MASNATNKVIWRALAAYSKVFQRFETAAIMWDGKNRQFQFVSKNRNLLPWIFNIMIALVLHGVGLSGFLVIREIFRKESIPAIWTVIVHLVIVGLSCACISLAVVLNIYGQNAVDAWNSLGIMERSLNSGLPDDDKKSYLLLHLFGMSLVCMIYMFAIFPLLLTPVIVLLQAHPLQLICAELLEMETYNRFEFQVVLCIVSLVVAFIGCIEVCRILLIFIVYVVLILKILRNVIIMMGKPKLQIFEQRIIEYSTGMIIINSIYAPFAQHLTSLLMGSGILLSVSFNFVALRMYEKIPPALYAIFPIGALIIPIVIKFTLPPAIEIGEETSDLLRKWKSKRYKKNDNIKRRQLRALRPWSISAGFNSFTLFTLQNSTKTTFYDIIVNYTITVLLSIKV